MSGILKLSTFDRAFWIMVVCVTVMFLFVRSRFGRTVQAIREDYIAASASGINVTYYKVLTFAVSAFFAGVGGSVYAHYMTAMIPTNFNFNYSAELLSEVIIGGTGSLTGSIIGAAFLSSLPELMLISPPTVCWPTLSCWCWSCCFARAVSSVAGSSA